MSDRSHQRLIIRLKNDRKGESHSEGLVSYESKLCSFGSCTQVWLHRSRGLALSSETMLPSRLITHLNLNSPQMLIVGTDFEEHFGVVAVELACGTRAFPAAIPHRELDA